MGAEWSHETEQANNEEEDQPNTFVRENTVQFTLRELQFTAIRVVFWLICEVGIVAQNVSAQVGYVINLDVISYHILFSKEAEMSPMEIFATFVFPNPDPFLQTTFVIQLHVLAAFMMIGFTFAVVLSPKGTLTHKRMGRGWMLAALVVALSSFFISEIRQIGPFSWIHLLSILTLVGIAQAIFYARAGRITEHKSTMIWMIIGGVVIAGGFTFLPGRLMAHVFFGY